MFKLLPIVLATLVAGCGQPKATLNVITVPDYIDPKVVRDFEHDQNCRVIIDFLAGDASTEAKLAAGGAAVYDVALLASQSIESCKRLGLLARLRHEN